MVDPEDDNEPVIRLSAKHRAKRLGRTRPPLDAGPPRLYGAETPPYEITIRPGEKEVETRIENDGKKLTVIVKNRRTLWRFALVIGGALLAAVIAHVFVAWIPLPFPLPH